MYLKFAVEHSIAKKAYLTCYSSNAKKRYMCASVACEAKLLSYTLNTCVSKKRTTRECVAIKILNIHSRDFTKHLKHVVNCAKTYVSKGRGCFTLLLKVNRLDDRKQG